MAEISRIGCAIEDEEGEIGCPCVGHPILDLTGGVIADIAVADTSAQIRLAIRNSSAGALVFDHSGNVNAAISRGGYDGSDQEVKSLPTSAHWFDKPRPTFPRALGFIPVKIESSGQ
jgi:DNA-binding IclR family transcriptional regulator